MVSNAAFRLSLVMFFQVGWRLGPGRADVFIAASVDRDVRLPDRVSSGRDRPARHVGQSNVERDGAGVELASEGKPGGSAERNQDFDSPVVGEFR